MSTANKYKIRYDVYHCGDTLITLHVPTDLYNYGKIDHIVNMLLDDIKSDYERIESEKLKTENIIK